MIKGKAELERKLMKIEGALLEDVSVEITLKAIKRKDGLEILEVQAGVGLHRNAALFEKFEVDNNPDQTVSFQEHQKSDVEHNKYYESN